MKSLEIWIFHLIAFVQTNLQLMLSRETLSSADVTTFQRSSCQSVKPGTRQRFTLACFLFKRLQNSSLSVNTMKTRRLLKPADEFGVSSSNGAPHMMDLKFDTTALHRPKSESQSDSDVSFSVLTLGHISSTRFFTHLRAKSA